MVAVVVEAGMVAVGEAAGAGDPMCSSDLRHRRPTIIRRQFTIRMDRTTDMAAILIPQAIRTATPVPVDHHLRSRTLITVMHSPAIEWPRLTPTTVVHPTNQSHVAADEGALCHRKQINLPPRPGHGSLKVSHEPPGGVHTAGARPRLAGEVLAENIEQGMSVGGIQATIGCCTGIVGVQGPN